MFAEWMNGRVPRPGQSQGHCEPWGWVLVSSLWACPQKHPDPWPKELSSLRPDFPIDGLQAITDNSLAAAETSSRQWFSPGHAVCLKESERLQRAHGSWPVHSTDGGCFQKAWRRLPEKHSSQPALRDHGSLAPAMTTWEMCPMAWAWWASPNPGTFFSFSAD